jgi:hypothetical protein
MTPTTAESPRRLSDLQVPAHGIVKLAESACGEDDLG